tara:strand:+ start:1490 stop:1867 length:378 start_codon:yes stop_codon:yes gene_type:complete
MKKEKSLIRKEQLISLWTRMCKTLNNDTSYSVEGSDSSPYYVLNVSEGISLYISAQETKKGNSGYDYTIGVVFGEFVNYKDFDMNESEFDSLANLFTTSRNDVLNEKVKNIVESKEGEFFHLLNN